MWLIERTNTRPWRCTDCGAEHPVNTRATFVDYRKTVLGPFCNELCAKRWCRAGMKGSGVSPPNSWHLRQAKKKPQS